jgi:dipeptidyl aminopeptidase/acylaminoacyl peptidase
VNEVEEGYHLIDGVRFGGGNNQRIIVRFHNHGEDWSSVGATEYQRTPDGTWQVRGVIKGEPEGGNHVFEVVVKQGVNEPPLLVAANKKISRVIWDPNPQLKDIEIDRVSVFKWTDDAGREWKGGLFKPSNYALGRRYPLVIQTHGFSESEFKPSGSLPTAFAARALAASGIVVLQVGEGKDCPLETLDEGPCFVIGYEAAARQLVSEGLVDPERIGIIGFSRTCFHVMETLTTGRILFRAASITDGVTGMYFQYLMFVGTTVESTPQTYDSMIGAKPFGQGLQQWLKRSPGFNLDKIKVPLLVVGEGPYSLLFMWEPYAGLRYLHKPVDLMMLNTNEHVLTNPAVRLASMGGTVDWFRFWLKDEEDSAPAKADQYERWRRLRRLQEENDKESRDR